MEAYGLFNLLVVDGALREKCTLEWPNVDLDFASESTTVGVRVNEAVLQNEAGCKIALDHSEPLRSTRVYMRRVHAAGVQEGDGSRETLLGKDREVLDVRKLKPPTLALGRCLVEVEDDTVLKSCLIEELCACTINSEELVEAADVGDLGIGFESKGCVRLVGCCFHVTWNLDRGGDGEGAAGRVGAGWSDASVLSCDGAGCGVGVLASVEVRAGRGKGRECGEGDDFGMHGIWIIGIDGWVSAKVC